MYGDLSESNDSSEEDEQTDAFGKLMLSSQSSQEKRKYVGRKQEQEIHNYFEYNKTLNKSTCKVTNCKAEISGKKSSNLKTHLKAFHGKEYGNYLQEENKRKAKKSKSEASTSQAKITFFGSQLKTKKYDKNHPIVKGFMLRLVKLISTTSLPVSLVIKDVFRELIWYFDPKIPFPNQNGMVNEINKVYEEGKKEIKNKIKNANKLILGSDIWSKKGLAESYLAINCYFYDENEKRKNVLVLALRLFPHPHSAENIKNLFQETIKEYEIEYEKIFKVITDNGSNMIKTFKIEWIDNRNSYDDEDCNLGCDMQLQDLLEESIENDFDNEENDLNEKFKKIKISRIPCVIHMIQCAIKTIEKKSKFKTTIKLATKLINKFRQSGKLAESLVSESNSKLPTITPTRWNCLYLQLDSFYNKKEIINKLCLENKIDLLRINEWNDIENYIKIYKPFDLIINQLSREEKTTISSVVSSVSFLKHHLNNLILNENEIIKFEAQILIDEIEKRFDNLINPKNGNFFD